MKCFARHVRRALILVLAISASALAQVPYQHPIAPPEARRHNYAQPARAPSRLRKLAPVQPLAGKRGRKPAARAPRKRRLH